jgi:hypothetical protein
MNSPEQSAKVVNAVKPVKHKILADQEDSPICHLIVDLSEFKLVKIIKNKKTNTSYKDIKTEI